MPRSAHASPPEWGQGYPNETGVRKTNIRWSTSTLQRKVHLQSFTPSPSPLWLYLFLSLKTVSFSLSLALPVPPPLSLYPSGFALKIILEATRSQETPASHCRCIERRGKADRGDAVLKEAKRTEKLLS